MRFWPFSVATCHHDSSNNWYLTCLLKFTSLIWRKIKERIYFQQQTEYYRITVVLSWRRIGSRSVTIGSTLVIWLQNVEVSCLVDKLNYIEYISAQLQQIAFSNFLRSMIIDPRKIKKYRRRWAQALHGCAAPADPGPAPAGARLVDPQSTCGVHTRCSAARRASVSCSQQPGPPPGYRTQYCTSPQNINYNGSLPKKTLSLFMTAHFTVW